MAWFFTIIGWEQQQQNSVSNNAQVILSSQSDIS
jgi:hypothetical protein